SGGARRAILMIDAVEPVAANAAFEPFIGPWIDRGSRRHFPMESCIKDGYLRDRAQQLLDEFHSFQFGLIVERRERGGAGDRRFDFRCDQRRFFKMRSSVYDAMSHDVDSVERQDASQQMLHRLRTRRDLDPILLHDAVCVLQDRRRDITVPLNLALAQTGWRILRESLANLVDASLLTAGTRIEYEDLHLFSDGCALSRLHSQPLIFLMAARYRACIYLMVSPCRAHTRSARAQPLISMARSSSSLPANHRHARARTVCAPR